MRNIISQVRLKKLKCISRFFEFIKKFYKHNNCKVGENDLTFGRTRPKHLLIQELKRVGIYKYIAVWAKPNHYSKSSIVYHITRLPYISSECSKIVQILNSIVKCKLYCQKKIQFGKNYTSAFRAARYFHAVHFVNCIFCFFAGNFPLVKLWKNFVVILFYSSCHFVNMIDRIRFIDLIFHHLFEEFWRIMVMLERSQHNLPHVSLKP